MSESKVFMFPDGGSNSNSIDPNLLMALNNNGGFGGNGSWLWIIFLFFLWPLMRNGGYWGGNNGGGSDAYLANLANNDQGRQMLMSAILGNGNAISNLATTLGCNVDSIQTAINGVMASVSQVGNQVGLTGMQTINAVLAGNTALGQQIAECCCENRLAICQQTNAITNGITNATTTLGAQINNVAVALERGFSNLSFATQQLTCGIENSIRDLGTQIANQFASLETRALQERIADLEELKNTLNALISNDRQTAQVAAMISPLQKELADIKAAQPQTVTLPYSCATAVPTGLVWGTLNNGLYNNSIWS